MRQEHLTPVASRQLCTCVCVPELRKLERTRRVLWRGEWIWGRYKLLYAASLSRVIYPFVKSVAKRLPSALYIEGNFLRCRAIRAISAAAILNWKREFYTTRVMCIQLIAARISARWTHQCDMRFYYIQKIFLFMVYIQVDDFALVTHFPWTLWNWKSLI